MLQRPTEGFEQRLSWSGRDRVHVTRKAVDFWYHHRAELNLSVRAFLEQCRLSSDERTISFPDPQVARAST